MYGQHDHVPWRDEKLLIYFLDVS